MRGGRRAKAAKFDLNESDLLRRKVCYYIDKLVLWSKSKWRFFEFNFGLMESGIKSPIGKLRPRLQKKLLKCCMAGLCKKVGQILGFALKSGRLFIQQALPRFSMKMTKRISVRASSDLNYRITVTVMVVDCTP